MTIVTNLTDVGEEQMAGVVADALRAYDAGASGAAVVSEGVGVTVTFPDGTQYEVVVQKLHDGISDVLTDAPDAEPEMDAATLTRWVHEVAPGVPVEIWHTGGGCATLYVGTTRTTAETDDEERWLVGIGPGSYNWDVPSSSTFGFIELFVGPDDCGEHADLGAWVHSERAFKAHLRRLLLDVDWRDEQPNGGTAR